MKNLFKYAGTYWKAMLAVIAVLILQAYCDLSLPAYTSDIVNIGIQQGGIEDKVPTAIGTDDMEKVLLFVPEEAQKEVVDSYKIDAGSYDTKAYVLKDSVKKDEKKMQTLSDKMSFPMMMVTGISSDSSMTADMEAKMAAQLPQDLLTEDTDLFTILQMLPAEQREEFVRQAKEQIEEMPDTILEQAAISFSKTAYKHLGMDMDALQLHYLFTTGGKMVALAFLGMAASVLVGFLASRVGASTGRDLRSRVFKKVVGFSNSEFDHFSTASLITRSTNDIQQIQLLIVMLLRVVLYAPILAIGGIYQVFQTNVSMSWIIGLAVLLIAVVILVLFIVAMPKFKMLQNLVDKLNLVTREILTGLPVIRAFSTQKHEEKRFDAANKKSDKDKFIRKSRNDFHDAGDDADHERDLGIDHVVGRSWDQRRADAGRRYDGIYPVYDADYHGILMLCMLSIMLPRAAVAADRVEEILTSKTIIRDPKKPAAFSGEKRGILEFDHVSFCYPGADEEVLHDITFTARPGETTAIIGSTGSGKSTLVDLIPRFYDVTEGAIRLDGEDIRDVKQHDLRERLGYVPQKGILFSGDIASNILFGNSDGSEDEMKEAAQIAQAAEFIRREARQI